MAQTTNPKIPGYNTRKVALRDVREGDIIAVDGEAQTITGTHMESTGSGWHFVVYYASGFVGGPGDRALNKLYPVPSVGDGATSPVGSDRYPYTVTKVSKSGATIEVRRCNAKIVSGNWTDAARPVIEYSETDHESTPARWSRTKGCYVSKGGARFVTGFRDYYQDPHR